MKKEVLLTPGPSQVPHRVAAAGAAPIMHHRTAEFGEIFARAVAGMKKVYGTEGDVFIIASSGSGAMEMAVVNALS
ncbi:MAG TPA: alanine--glyoxylate aminotransferase family protein, partial [bacterium]|nr:alanine--glyoxylate aminotransferase family protein [bacterium]